MTYLDQKIEESSRLPLKDAAFNLWHAKYRLDREEFPPPEPTMKGADVNDPEVLKAVFQMAYAKVQHDQDSAHEGPTFSRLKKAHPEASDQDLKIAVQAAVKLDRDCLKYYVYFSSHTDHFSALQQALTSAKKENPGFLEATCALAHEKLAREMR